MAGDPAAVLRVQNDALGAQEVEAREVAALIQRSVGAFDHTTQRSDDEGERRHAAAADAAEEVRLAWNHRGTLG